MHRGLALLMIIVFACPALVSGAETGALVPGEQWQRYVDPADAGFDAGKLVEAKKVWEELPSSAFMVIANGAVVASWGDIDRRFMCHSVRKSFLSALYGVYWDRGAIDLNKNLVDLGIDDIGDGLLDSEKQARILDLLKARSGVFHPAAYAGRTDSQARGSQGPGRYFAYNNWDFNTLVTIFEQEAGVGVFEAFDEHFAGPLHMEDWRVTDGYYHYERDKSMHPAYPFRLSARDAARLGLLFARDGRWGDEQILSHHWVRRSSALYSIDDEVFGYGFMWWVAREPRFEKHGFFAALGVGNQMIAALPDSDLVIVNRANTYRGEGTPTGPLLDLIEQVLEARTLAPAVDPRLASLEAPAPESYVTEAPADAIEQMKGTWPYPPAPLGLDSFTTVEMTPAEGHVIGYSPESGTFKLYLQSDGWLIEEDSQERYLPILGGDGGFAGISTAGTVIAAALEAASEGDMRIASDRMALVESEGGLRFEAAEVIVGLIQNPESAESSATDLRERSDPRRLERTINSFGYNFLGSDKAELAENVFALNTRLFPEAYNTWDSLAEAQRARGKTAESIRNYEKTLELNPENRGAQQALEELRSGTDQ